MQPQITVLSLVLALSSLGLARPPHTHKSPAIRHKGHQEDPLSDLHTVSVLKTTMKTVHVPASSICLHTHMLGSHLMTYSSPFTPESALLSPSITPIIEAGYQVPTHGHLYSDLHPEWVCILHSNRPLFSCERWGWSICSQHREAVRSQLLRFL